MLRLILFVLAMHTIIGQNLSPVSDLTGLGPAGIASNQETTFFDNPVAMLRYKKTTIEAGYYIPFSQPLVGLYTTAITIPGENYSIGAGFSHFGGENMYSNQIVIQGAIKKENFSFGSSIRIDQLTMTEIRSHLTYSIDIAGKFQVSENSLIAASVKNLTHSNWNNEHRTPYYYEYRLGFGHKISEKLFLSSALRSSLEDELTGSIAISNLIKDSLRFDFGTNISPSGLNGGIHLILQKVIIHYSSRWIPDFPLSHGFNLKYKL
ncbi:hypothetical protein OO013_01030 [Mangrovivirga sp. M17]|uniref:Type IX secretion system membrane protein PorP/SprF n=1 Tax=Mangrovivirga halotolerans TaxID=2993936 RepID=A0ABT3RKT4_9BACT|nr:hypothetical protein [Mangrovivirga halotolerans]MCX2742424.1 hypothetical protein [Mangrovivirga halotolerans]